MKEIIRYMLRPKMTFRAFVLWAGFAAVVWLVVGIVFRIYQIATWAAENAPQILALATSGTL